MIAKRFFSNVFILFLVFSTNIVLARGGGGGGHGGFGGGGGFHGSFARGFHYGYYGRGGYFVSWGFWDYFIFYGVIILIALLFFTSTIVFWKSKYSKKILAKISFSDSFWNMAFLKQNARNTFLRIQDAWEAREIQRVRGIITPELFNQYDRILTEMRNKGEKNVIRDIKISEIHIISCEDFKDNSKDRYIAHIQGDLLDYTLNVYTGKTIKNPDHSREDFTDTYHFVRLNNKWILEDIDNSVSFWDVLKSRNYMEK